MRRAGILFCTCALLFLMGYPVVSYSRNHLEVCFVSCRHGFDFAALKGGGVLFCTYALLVHGNRYQQLLAW